MLSRLGFFPLSASLCPLVGTRGGPGSDGVAAELSVSGLVSCSPFFGDCSVRAMLAGVFTVPTRWC